MCIVCCFTITWIAPHCTVFSSSPDASLRFWCKRTYSGFRYWALLCIQSTNGWYDSNAGCRSCSTRWSHLMLVNLSPWHNNYAESKVNGRFSRRFLPCWFFTGRHRQPEHLLYKAAVSLFLSVCLSVCLLLCLSVCQSVPPPPFRHDRRTATKFGTHIRIDTGLALT